MTAVAQVRTEYLVSGKPKERFELLGCPLLLGGPLDGFALHGLQGGLGLSLTLSRVAQRLEFGFKVTSAAVQPVD